MFGSLHIHDLTISKDMLIESPWLKHGDNLNIDRGFLDRELQRALNEKGVSVTIPAKKNMEIYQAAVEIAVLENKWCQHPNSKRKNQKIQLIKDLESFYQGDHIKEQKYKKEMKLNAAVVQINIKKDKTVETDHMKVSKDKKYAYAVILCINNVLSAREIIENQETRWGCEEDYRQLKDF